MDLRVEPVVCHFLVPKIEPDRYYTGQMIDLYTYNSAYLGTRAYGNDGGTFLVAGPGWNGEKPGGVKEVIGSETQFAYLLFRTQLFNMADLATVNKIQSGYSAQQLSAFLKQPAPSAAPTVNWPKPADIAAAPSRPTSFPPSTSSSSSARRMHRRALCSRVSRRSTSGPGRASTSTRSPPRSSRPSTMASRTRKPISTAS